MNQELIMMFNGDETVHLAAANETDGVIAALYNEIQQNNNLLEAEDRQIVVVDESQNLVSSNFSSFKDVENYKVDDGTALVTDDLSHAADLATNSVDEGNIIIMDDGVAVSLADENCLKSKNLDLTDSWKMGLLEANGLVPHNEEPVVEPEKQTYQLWECPKCTALFRDKDTCETHVVKAHDFTCGLCSEPFQEKDDLENHIIKHISEIPGHVLQMINRPTEEVNVAPTPIQERSETIKSDFDSLIANSQQLAPITSSDDVFICSSCGLSFLSSQNLKEHEETHADEDSSFQSQEVEPSPVPAVASPEGSESSSKGHPQITCDLCDKVCYTKNSLLLHMNKRHCGTSAKKYPCNECSQSFKWKLSLDNHIAISHSRKKRCMTCSICDEVCRGVEALNKHMKTHEDETDSLFACDTCGEKFQQSSSLLTHIKAMHPNFQEFSCTECGKNFKIKKYLEAHVSEVHDQKESNKCRYCLKSFMSMDSLLNHMSSHHASTDEENKFTCTICNSTFSTAREHYQHMAIHVAEIKNFECGLCDKSFHDQETLDEHFATHNDFINQEGMDET